MAFAVQPPLYTASEKALGALFHEEEKSLGPHELPLPDRNDPDTLFALLDDPDFREPSFLFFIAYQTDRIARPKNHRLTAALHSTDAVFSLEPFD